MMSSENIPPPAAPETQTAATGSRKTPAQRSQPHEQQPVKCPRCDSSNTKFCYYNNYSLSQPRHFCKTCRRYWTKGGALRNVPIGGGCRKTKKLRPTTASAASRILSGLNPPGTTEFGPGGGFKFLDPAAAPAMEFQLGGLSLPRLHPATAGVYTQFVSGGPGCVGLDLLGLNYPAPNSSGSGHANTTTSSSVVQEHQISLSSIESLSSINQEMHWKLQQQRLALIYGNPTAEDDQDHHHGDHHQNQKQTEKPAPPTAMNLFQNFEVLNNNNHHSVSKVNDIVATANNGDHHHHQQQQIISCEDGGRKFEVGPTEWFFEQTAYTPSNNTSTPTASEIETSGAHLNGIQTASVSWGHLHQFNGLQSQTLPTAHSSHLAS
ncbi:hypothetical protein Cgig2_007385 [Carnegiea gigantea]|uniref:Dof zinc finger protein n=1 Tax=Carnegiea gigantea TaxID=171969 RepID=A0A9Q1QRI5_9CARY|nr:hypothetical protein Cgig2_007385 [Carnegiea gigantea]